MELILGIDNLDDLKAGQIEGKKVAQLIQLLAKSLVFDEKFYVKTYQDIKDGCKSGSIASAHEHYYTHGIFEGRLPSLNGFDPKAYMAANEDLVFNLGKNPSKQSLIEHYIHCGFSEGRDTEPREFESS